jgi:sec-independent protein translocase protein TatB
MNSIFGIGVLEFIFILIFALIFLGPDRLPRVTKDVLQFIRKLQRLSSELTKQVNEEIGDLRELDPSYHMKELMEDEEEDEKPAKGAGQKSTAAKGQTSAPSQQVVGRTNVAGAEEDEKNTIAPKEAAATAAPALSNLNSAASANGQQQSDEGAGDSPKTTGGTVSSAPRASSAGRVTSSPTVGSTPRQTGSTQKRGVKTLAELRKQQRTKRQSSSGDSSSTYLAERNKRAQRRADDRRDAVAAQKAESASISGDDGGLDEPSEAQVDDNAAVLAVDESADGEVQAEVRDEEPDGEPVAVVEEASDETGGDGGEETKA